MTRPQYNFKTLDEFFNFLCTATGYLEKTNGSNLGDFTNEGKTINAGYNNYTVYWQWYKELGYGNLQAQAYCAGAVSTMMANAFGLNTAKKLLCGDLYVYCPTGYNQFKCKGRIYDKPKVGDIVFFWSDSLGRWSHTGVVLIVDSDGKGYTTWEANTSGGNDIVVRNGGATRKKHYTLGSGKVAFGRPDYEGNGISTSIPVKSDLETFDVGTYGAGLACTTDLLNVRDYPSTGKIVGTIKKGAHIIPTKKAFINGKAWYYIPSKNGWVSASYFTGWVQEKSDNDQWWYLLSGYKYYTDQIAIIDGSAYYFASNGYMYVGKITFETDPNGVLKKASSN